jgi:plastocyanin
MFRTETGVLAVALLALSAPAYADKHTVVQKAKTFSATELTVKTGDEILFQNSDDITHNIFTNSAGNAFNLKTQAPGTASGHVFTAEGVAEIRCAFHPKMKLTVTVKK